MASMHRNLESQVSMGDTSEELYLGIDLGGTNLKAGLVNSAGRIRQRRTIPVPSGSSGELIAFIKNLVDQIKKRPGGDQLAGIGIGIPGSIHFERQEIIASPNLIAVTEPGFLEGLKSALDMPVVFDNDANVNAYGEFRCGAGREARNMALITLGTGVGGGLILNGEPWHGSNGFGAEIGHMIVELDGDLCPCGDLGCLEAYASATALVQAFTRKAPDSPPLDAREIANAARNGFEPALWVLRRTGRYLGIACANLLNVLNLELIVIGGGLGGAKELIIEPTRKAAENHAFGDAYRVARIESATLGAEAGVVGAALLAAQVFSSKAATEDPQG